MRVSWHDKTQDLQTANKGESGDRKWGLRAVNDLEVSVTSHYPLCERCDTEADSVRCDDAQAGAERDPRCSRWPAVTARSSRAEVKRWSSGGMT